MVLIINRTPSTYERSLRLLSLLDTAGELDDDRWTYIDYICIHGMIFHISKTNIQNMQRYNRAMFVNDISLNESAMKMLLLEGKIKLHGGLYTITKLGHLQIKMMNDDYLNELIENCKKFIMMYGNLDNEAIYAMITKSWE